MPTLFDGDLEAERSCTVGLVGPRFLPFCTFKKLFLGKKWCKTGKLEQNLWFVGLFVLSHSRLILKIAFVDKQIHAMQHQITSGHQLNHVRVVVHKFIR